MMTLSLILACAIAAEPTPDQLELLKVFRAEFIEITPGRGPFPKTFQMGREGGNKAESPAHMVTMRYPFWIAKYEVPQNLWTAVMGSNPSKWKGARNSGEMLSFDEAQEFCRRATTLMRTAKLIATDEVVSLPTEAEWEYVARAGTTTLYSFGDDRKDLGDHAWSTENAAGNDPPVGAKKPNPWGVFDVHGYLWEWCLDIWHEDYTNAPNDGSAWIQGDQAERGVARSGSWKDSAAKLTSTYRQPFPKETRDDALGLRCVLLRTENREMKSDRKPDSPGSREGRNKP